MPSSKSNSRRVLGVGIVVCILVIVLGVIGLVWTTSAPSPRPTSTSTGESSAKSTETQEPRETSADGDARNASWISFERILLLAVVVVNYLLLAVVAWSYWRAGRRPDLGSVLSQHFQGLVARLDGIESALRTGPPKSTTPPLPATPDPAPRAKNYELPREPASRAASRAAPEPMQWAQVSQESPSLPARMGPVDESRRSSESRARNLVNQYCLIRGSSVVDLGQHAREMGLQFGSPSSTRGQRHVLEGPDQDSRLLAVRDDREERLLVIVGAGASVAQSEWLDLFEMRAFIGYCAVRSKRPAIVNAVSGVVEEKGELEVLGPT